MESMILAEMHTSLSRGDMMEIERCPEYQLYLFKKILKFYFLKHLFLHHIIKIKYKSFLILKNSYVSEYLHAKIFIYGLQYKYY